MAATGLFSLFLLVENAEKTAFIGSERGEEKERRKTMRCHIYFYDGSRTEIFFTLSVPEKSEKWEFFGD